MLCINADGVFEHHHIAFTNDDFIALGPFDDSTAMYECGLTEEQAFWLMFTASKRTMRKLRTHLDRQATRLCIRYIESSTN